MTDYFEAEKTEFIFGDPEIREGMVKLHDDWSESKERSDQTVSRAQYIGLKRRLYSAAHFSDRDRN